MTTAIHHGDPGSFKSFSVVQRVMVPSVLGIVTKDENGNKITEARPIVTNIRGFNSIERIETALGKKVHPDSEIIYVEADSTKGFDVMGKFFHWVPKGALIVIDEAQRVFSKRRHRNLSCYDLPLDRFQEEGITQHDSYPLWDGDYDRPTDVENAFDQHRHYNWDIYLCTPNIAKLHPEIREVAEVAYRHKGRGHLLKSWKLKWREYAHDPEVSGKSPAHYEGTPKTYKADKKYFACYQSTKTGKAKSTSEVRAIYSDPKLLFYLCLSGLFFSGFIYQALSFAEAQSETVENVEVSISEGVPLSEKRLSGSTGDVGAQLHSKSGIQASFDQLDWLSDSSSNPDDLISKHLLEGRSLRLSAFLVVPSTGAKHYRIAVLDGDTVVDRFTPEDVRYFGYREQIIPNGLILKNESGSIVVRQWVFASTRRDDEQQRGEFAKDASIGIPFSHLVN